jgi:DNA-binding transcriptional ArsR family regulator
VTPVAVARRPTAPDDLSNTFAALADPTRRAILTRLAAGEATVGQLAEPFALTQQAISKHLKVLERAGLISRSRAAQARPCRLEPAQLDQVADWVGRHRQAWHERYDRLDQHLAALEAGGPQRDQDRAAPQQGTSRSAQSRKEPRT